MSEWQLLKDPDGRSWHYLRQSFRNAGLDSYTSAPAQNPDSMSVLTNVLFAKDGSLRKRWGVARFDSMGGGTAIALETARGRFYQYSNLTGSTIRILAIGGPGGVRKAKSAKVTLVAGEPVFTVENTNIFSFAGSGSVPRAVISRGRAYFASGDTSERIQWDGNDTAGSGTTTWGITGPTAALAGSSSGSGSVTIKFWRDYCYAYQNTTTGQISDISPFVRVSAFSDKAQVDLTSITVSSGETNGVNQRLVLATSDGGPRTRLYKVGVIANNTGTTLTDSNTEETLLNNDVYVEVDELGTKHGILDNTRPPATGKYPTRHRGRLFLAVDQNLYFSKNIEEVSTSSGFELGGRWEECWPADYVLPVSRFGDVIEGFLSDGTFLYIGTKRAIYRLEGDGPENFLPVDILFDGVGILNQDVWQLVYRNGIPVGGMWVTPDYAVLLSDFNTYQNVGIPITAALRSDIGQDAAAIYSGYDQYNMYILSDGSPDGGITPSSVAWVFDLDQGIWGTWAPTPKPEAFFYWLNMATNVTQLIFPSTGDKWYSFDRTKATDITEATQAALTFDVTIETSLLDFGMPMTRKFVQTLDVANAGTLASLGTKTRIFGATTASELATPVSVGTPVDITPPLGEHKLTVAGKATGYRYHSAALVISDAATTSTTALLRSLDWNFVPVHIG